YDPINNQWSSDFTPMSSCRKALGVAALDDCIYAAGGHNGVECLDVVERCGWGFTPLEYAAYLQCSAMTFDEMNGPMWHPWANTGMGFLSLCFTGVCTPWEDSMDNQL
ncbi:kelch repeat protein, partial [Teladorsagia circumcincta]